MAGRPAPTKPSQLHAAVLAEIRRQGLSGYRLQKATGIPLRTIQRFIAAENSPTVATLETIATAIGLELRVDRSR